MTGDLRSGRTPPPFDGQVQWDRERLWGFLRRRFLLG